MTAGLKASPGATRQLVRKRAIGELRISFGPGYRVYFVRRGMTVVILMSGGDKRTQVRDIRDAIAMAQEV